MPQTASFHVNDLKHLGDLQLLYKFKLKFSIPYTGFTNRGFFTTSLNSGGLTNFNILCKELSLPGRKIEPINTDYMGWKKYFAGKNDSSGQMTLTFHEHQAGLVTAFKREWFEGINQTNERGARRSFQASDNMDFLKATLEIGLLKTDGTDSDIYGIIYGSFPIDDAQTALSQSASEFMKPQIQLNYDWSEVKLRSQRNN